MAVVADGLLRVGLVMVVGHEFDRRPVLAKYADSAIVQVSQEPDGRLGHQDKAGAPGQGRH